jgi:predicted CXXCH cytochrome family protein
MLRRVRTTKNLAKRIDMQYFARPHPLRRWRFLLSVALPLIGVVWLLSHWVVSQEPFSSGPVSASHAAFVTRCALCHTGEGGHYFKAVTEKACLGCHDAPPHHPKTVLFTPTCGSCHQEHRSRARLIEVRDQACAECHADLKLRGGAATLQNVSRFGGSNHPEFAAKRSGSTDPGKIKFNHQVHVALGGCDSCHTAAGLTEVAGKADSGSPIAVAKLRPGTPLNDVSGAYMLPIKFADHCASCHADKLEFDKTILESVPHTTPQAIHAEIMKHAPGKEAQVAALEIALWEKCSFCHVLKVKENELPEVASPGLKTRWFERAMFSHEVHSVFTCQSCHAAAANSTTASDVLLPGIAKCESCHHPKGARSGCSECHSYHDWSTRKPVQAPLDVACAGQGSTAAACQGSGTGSGAEILAATR